MRAQRFSGLMAAVAAVVALGGCGGNSGGHDGQILPGQIEFTGASYSVNEDGTPIAAVTLRRVNGIDKDVSVTVTPTDGTAIGSTVPNTPGTDFLYGGIQVFWANGDATDKVVQIPVFDDHLDEGSETINLALSNPTNGATLGSPTLAVLTVVDNDTAGTIQFTQGTYAVREDGVIIQPVMLRRTGGQDGDVSVTITMADGTATGGTPPLTPPTDYDSTPIVVAFADGDSADKVVNIPIVADSISEPDEFFYLALTTPTGNVTIGTQAGATVTIVTDDQRGTLSFSAGSYTYLEDGTTVAPITVIRTNGSMGAVAATVTFVNGTAVGGPAYAAGVDFINAPVVVNFGDGDTAAKTVYLPINPDHVVEAAETLVVLLGNATNGAAIGAQSSASVTINDDDHAGALAFTSATFAVREDGTLVNAVMVRRTGGQDGAVSATLTFADITATGGGALAPPVDYLNAPIVVTFADQDAADKVVIVPITNDTVPEPDETAQLTLGSPTNGAILGAVSSAVLTILTDDQRGTVAFTAAAFAVSEAGIPVQAVTLSRTNGSQGAVSVTMTLANGTATGGPPPLLVPIDYDNTSIVVSWADGDSANKVVAVPILSDHVVEPNETVNLALGAPTNGVTIGVQNAAVLTINNDDAAGSLSFASSTFAVNEDGTVVNAVRVTRTGGQDGVVSATITLANGTATGGIPPLAPPLDYDNTSVVVAFSDQDALDKIITVPVLNDNVSEPDETVNLALVAPSGGASLGPISAAVLTIVTDDQRGEIGFTSSAYSVNEDGTPITQITLARTNGNMGQVSVTVTPSNGTATGGPAPLTPSTDFDNTPIVVTWNDGDSANKVIAVSVNDDHSAEGNETIALAIGSPTNGVGIGVVSAATVTIVDNDVAGTLNFAAPTFSVNEDGTPISQIRVTRTNGHDGPVSATITMSDITAVGGGALGAGVDYVNTPITVTFADQDAADQLVTVPINNDHVVEGAETFLATLGSPTNGAVLGASLLATVTIVDNDVAGLIQFSAAAYSVQENGTPVTQIRLQRLTGIDGAASATLNFAGGTATGSAPPLVPPADYDNTAIVVNWADQDGADKVVTVPILDDHVVEGNETFDATITAVTGAAAGAVTSATVTIIDNDSAGLIAFSQANYSQVENGANLIPVRVQRTGGADGAVSATITLAGITATAGTLPLASPADFDNTPIVVNWGDQDATDRVLTIPILDDHDEELAESFSLTLGGFTGGAAGGLVQVSTFTIFDNDNAGQVTFGNPSYSFPEAGGASNVLVVRRVNGQDGAVSATISFADVTATGSPSPVAPPSDYGNAPITVNWADQDNADKLVVVPILNDDLVEPAETFTATVAPVGTALDAGLYTSANVTIVDDDSYGALTFTAGAYSVREDGTTIAPITVHRANGIDGQVSVDVVWVFGGTATAGFVQPLVYPSDFDATTITVTFLDQDGADKVVNIPIGNDNVVEPDETVFYQLGNVTGGATLGVQTSCVLTIRDDDSAGVIDFVQASTTHVGGDGFTASIDLRRVGGSHGVVTVTVTATDGGVVGVNAMNSNPNSLFEPRDYVNPGPIVVTWADLDTANKTITIQGVADELPEPVEGFTLTITNPTGGAVLGLNTVETVTNDATDDGNIQGHPSPMLDSAYGTSLAKVGTYVAVGARYQPINSYGDAGAVFVFDPLTGNHVQTLLQPGIIGSNDEFGTSLAGDDDHLVVGAPNFTNVNSDQFGAVTVFNRNGWYVQQSVVDLSPSAGNNPHFGSAVAVGPGIYAVGAPSADTTVVTERGKAYVYDINTNALLLTLSAPNDSNPTDQFGLSLLISGNDLIVGAPGDTLGVGPYVGAVYVFDLANSGALRLTIPNPTGTPFAAFGYSLAKAGNDRLVVGAPTFFGGPPGQVFVFNLTTGALLAQINHPLGTPSAAFGLSVAATSQRIVVGAPFDPTSSFTEVGAVWSFDFNGTLIQQIPAPLPADFLDFGFAVLAYDDGVYVGAPLRVVNSMLDVGEVIGLVLN